MRRVHGCPGRAMCGSTAIGDGTVAATYGLRECGSGRRMRALIGLMAITTGTTTDGTITKATGTATTMATIMTGTTIAAVIGTGVRFTRLNELQQCAGVRGGAHAF